MMAQNSSFQYASDSRERRGWIVELEMYTMVHSTPPLRGPRASPLGSKPLPP
eukprot:m.51104 g.51104  ORF g.51104 m.51104 type:complete len:52 (+) comp12957_c0_seq2:648-803(+)